MFDGKRHIYAGHLLTLFGNKDGNRIFNADVMCMPREVYAGSDGHLYMRPPKEIVDIYKNTVLDLATKPVPDILYDTGIMTAKFWREAQNLDMISGKVARILLSRSRIVI